MAFLFVCVFAIRKAPEHLTVGVKRVLQPRHLTCVNDTVHMTLLIYNILYNILYC